MARRSPRTAPRPRASFSLAERDGDPPLGSHEADANSLLWQTQLRRAVHTRIDQLSLQQIVTLLRADRGRDVLLPIAVELLVEEPLATRGGVGDLLATVMAIGVGGDDHALVVDAWERARRALAESGDFDTSGTIDHGVPSFVVDVRFERRSYDASFGSFFCRVVFESSHGAHVDDRVHVVRPGSGGARSLELPKSNFAIGSHHKGRYGDVDIVVEGDADVAGCHACVRADFDGLHVVDYGSAAGVTVNGNFVDGCQAIAPTDVIGIGSLALRVVCEPRARRVLGDRFAVTGRKGDRRLLGSFRVLDRLDGGEAEARFYPRGDASDEVVDAVVADRLATIAGRLRGFRHPHAVPVLDAGVDDDGGVWFVTPLERMQRSLSADDDVYAAGIALCDVVAAALDHDLLHLDLSRETVGVDKHGAVRVCDFGLQGALRPPRSELRAQHLAPEQMVDDGDVGPATDVWQIASLLYAIVHRREPYGYSPMSHRLQQLPKPPAWSSSASPALGELVLSALAFEPAARPTAVAMGEALRRLAAAR